MHEHQPKEPEYCLCHCHRHKPGVIKHIIACCDVCPKCRQNIRATCLAEHMAKCKVIPPNVPRIILE
jgi:hypothetical protein